MYEKYFGLDQKPFNMTPDPEFLFFTERHREAFAHLMYGIRERRGFICITGEVGAGKTTLCRALLEEFDENTRLALVLNPMLSDAELLETINDEFFIKSPGKTKKELLDALNEYLIEQHSAGRNVVLLIDEAQNLSAETLEQVRIISNLETVKDKLIQIVLIGQPELRDKLSRPDLRQLNQRITVRYHLTPMTEEEASAYIHHRLSVAGSAGRIRFSPEAVREIYKYSGGIPRNINVICDRALLTAFVNESFDITRETVLKARAEVTGIPNGRSGGRIDNRASLKRGLLYGGLVLTALAFFAVLSYGYRVWQELQTMDIVPDRFSQASFPTDSPKVVPTIKIEPAPTVVEENVDDMDDVDTVDDVESKETEIELLSPVNTPEPSVLVVVSLPSTDTPTPPPTATPTEVPFEPPPLPPRPEYFGSAVAMLVKEWFPEDKIDGALLEQLKNGDPDLDGILKRIGLGRLEMILDVDSLLRLNIPVILEIQRPGTEAPQFAVLDKVVDGQIELKDPVQPGTTVSKDALCRMWFGRIHLCVPTGAVAGTILGPGSYGRQVHTLETDLYRLGYIKSNPDEVWDDETTVGLLAFQRDHSLKEDGLARIETQIVLFVTANRDRIPSLEDSPEEKRI